MRWFPVLLLTGALAACDKKLECDPSVAPFVERTSFGAGLVGQPVSLTLIERFCQRVIPGAAPSLELFGPTDLPYPVTLDGELVDETRSSVRVTFTPRESGSYFLKGMLAGRVGVVQLFIPVAVDRSDAGRVLRPTPRASHCPEATPFGARGIVCTDPNGGFGALAVGADERLTIGTFDAVTSDGEAAWVLDFSGRTLRRYVEAGDGGLEVRGTVQVPVVEGSRGTLTRAGEGRVVSSFGEMLVIEAETDGGLRVARHLGPGAASACLRGETLVQVPADRLTPVFLSQLSSGVESTVGASSTALGCTGESAWFGSMVTPGVSTLLPERLDGGPDVTPLMRLGDALLIRSAGELPFLNPVLLHDSPPGSLEGPVFPVLRGDHVELEYYGPGYGLSASEHSVMLRDDAGTWLVTRP